MEENEASEDRDAETERVEIAGHDDRPTEEVRPAAQDTGIIPGFDDREGPKSGSPRSRFTKNPRALTVALIVMGLTAGMLAVGSRVPASAAADCPPGMPSRSVSVTPSRTTAAAEKAAARPAARSSAGSSSSSSSSAPSSAKPTSAAPTASPTESKSGNKVVDGVKGIVDGVSHLLGLDDDPSSGPSTSQTTSPEPTTEPTKTTEPAKTADPSPTGTGETTPATGAAATGTTTPPSSAPSDDDNVIPCLGPRVFGLNGSAGGVPPVAAKAGLLETDLLTMYNSTYDGVVNLPTGASTSVRVLKFSMDRAVNKPFSLTIDEPTGGQTVITSNELTTDGHVEFYTSRMEGKLFGLIPVTFTPDQPPPLTLPILWFTDVKLQLNYVQCDVLTGIPLHIKEK